MPPSDLDARLLAAHAKRDRPALIALYLEASEQAPSDTAKGFFLTHAYVFALEAGDIRATALRAKLMSMDREV